MVAQSAGNPLKRCLCTPFLISNHIEDFACKISSNFSKWKKGWPNRLKIPGKEICSLNFSFQTILKILHVKFLQTSQNEKRVAQSTGNPLKRNLFTPFLISNHIEDFACKISSNCSKWKKGGPIDWKSPEKKLVHSISHFKPY